jgi:hypothetical protein
VLVYIDTAHASEQLVNRRLAYVAVSRARYDVQIYTNDKTQLAAHLQRDVSHRSAVEASQEQSQRPSPVERRPFSLTLLSPASRPRCARPSGRRLDPGSAQDSLAFAVARRVPRWPSCCILHCDVIF